MTHQKRTRAQEIAEQYFSYLDIHIQNVIEGKDAEFLGIAEIASHLAISHQHLIDLIQKEFGHHPCHFYDAKIIVKAKEMLLNTEVPVAEVARIFTYDPSNFSKFFKKQTGETPGSFRKSKK